MTCPTRAGRGAPRARSDDNVEVVFFHAWPTALYEELLTSYGMAGIVDLTAGPGCCAVASLRRRAPYTGVCFSTVHVEQLEMRLLQVLWKGYAESRAPWPILS